MLLILLLHALFGVSYIIGKQILTYSEPIFLTGSRMFISGGILLIYQYFYAHEEFHFKKSHIKYYVQITFFGIYITYMLRYSALKDLPVSKATFLFNLAPFVSSLYSYFFFKEVMSRKQWFGLIIGFLGLVPILLSSSPMEKIKGEFFFISLQEFYVILSVILHSYSWILIRQLVREKSYSPIMINGITMFSGGLLALLTSPITEGFFPIRQHGPFWLLLALSIGISNIICHNIYGYLLKKYTATFMSFTGFLGPLFAAFYGWLFLHDTLTWNYFLSTIIVLSGLYLFYQDELKLYQIKRNKKMSKKELELDSIENLETLE